MATWSYLSHHYYLMHFFCISAQPPTLFQLGWSATGVGSLSVQPNWSRQWWIVIRLLMEKWEGKRARTAMSVLYLIKLMIFFLYTKLIFSLVLSLGFSLFSVSQNSQKPCSNDLLTLSNVPLRLCRFMIRITLSYGSTQSVVWISFCL